MQLRGFQYTESGILKIKHSIYEIFNIFAIFEISMSYHKDIKNLFQLLVFITLTFIFFQCANQLPPGGGEEDKAPPKVRIISPKANSTFFTGNSIIIEFSEYVDRRSFQDAFRISPRVEGEFDFKWGGTEVEVVFPTDLQKIYPSKTFVININTALKDIRGNTISEPVTIAFSTGAKIDMGEVEGRVYNNLNKIVSVWAYNIENTTYDPVKNLPDYLTETSSEGNYKLTNLAPGKYRIITVNDEDRNLLFTNERESYGVLSNDLDLKDSLIISGVNFYMNDISNTSGVTPELDISKYFKDSVDIVYSSVENNSSIVLPEQSIFLYFSRYKPLRSDFVSSFKLTDENGTNERVVFNWENDSLVEIFAADKFSSNRKYNITFDLKVLNDSLYKFRLNFRTVSVNSFGDLKGRIITYNNFDFSTNIIKLNLESSKLVPLLRYNFDVRDSVFSFKNILESDYNMFAFIDLNNSGTYNYGYPYPFEFSEPFYIYPQSLNIKGGWTVENVTIIFNR